MSSKNPQVWALLHEGTPVDLIPGMSTAEASVVFRRTLTNPSQIKGYSMTGTTIKDVEKLLAHDGPQTRGINRGYLRKCLDVIRPIDQPPLVVSVAERMVHEFRQYHQDKKPFSAYIKSYGVEKLPSGLEVDTATLKVGTGTVKVGCTMGRLSCRLENDGAVYQQEYYDLKVGEEGGELSNELWKNLQSFMRPLHDHQLDLGFTAPAKVVEHDNGLDGPGL